MSNIVIALITALGGGAWIYNKMMRQTGGNTGNALTVAGIGALFLFALVLIVLGFVIS